jgi:hypothetical protein
MNKLFFVIVSLLVIVRPQTSAAVVGGSDKVCARLTSDFIASKWSSIPNARGNVEVFQCYLQNSDKVCEARIILPRTDFKLEAYDYKVAMNVGCTEVYQVWEVGHHTEESN